MILYPKKKENERALAVASIDRSSNLKMIPLHKLRHFQATFRGEVYDFSSIAWVNLTL